MCVIIVADDKRPSADMVTAAFDANPSGGGGAWRHNKAVVWKKGLDVEAMKELAETLPLPFILHFRIPSCGGPFKELCHPFPVDKQSTLALEGSTKGFVLFHNGHWNSWKFDTKEMAIKGGIQLPHGKYSDSRAMAVLAANFGHGILEFIDEKTVVFGPGKGEIYFTRGTDWKEVDGIWCSNDFFVNRSSSFRRTNAVVLGTEVDDSDEDGSFCGVDRIGVNGILFCKGPACRNVRIANTEYCFIHQYMSHMKANLESSGGDSSAVDATFRRDAETPKAGQADESSVEGSQAAPQTGAASHRESIVQKCLPPAREDGHKRHQTLSEVVEEVNSLAEQHLWACSINTKVTPHWRSPKVDRISEALEAQARKKRIEAAEKGIIVQGPM